jgi:hypothetical protein
MSPMSAEATGGRDEPEVWGGTHVSTVQYVVGNETHISPPTGPLMFAAARCLIASSCHFCCSPLGAFVTHSIPQSVS